ncbi:hypothetical protein [Clostridium intestinale]|uniref:Uncharacterized protein n=1 Tax=Clostridium intestinale DSM 6191 TaxID=1121320 RepID=A0A1M5WDG7_9CLOT|nr:hypothetical protein [Clostridium intestinale]SHH85467.1 hypothetical protein SAMN02745941_01041 [Clostridium intestinale DSM 6191]
MKNNKYIAHPMLLAGISFLASNYFTKNLQVAVVIGIIVALIMEVIKLINKNASKNLVYVNILCLMSSIAILMYLLSYNCILSLLKYRVMLISIAAIGLISVFIISILDKYKDSNNEEKKKVIGMTVMLLVIIVIFIYLAIK